MSSSQVFGVRVRSGSREGLGAAVFFVLLVAWVAAVWFSHPPYGAFNVEESSRNALNGAFVLDFIKELPWRDPVGWAKDYYFQYPALTILFYPPLFYLFLAGGYAMGGVSHETALAVMLVFYLVLGVGLYALGRQSLSVIGAGLFSLLFLTGLEVADIAREVLLEIPMLAFVVWSAWAAVRYARTERTAFLLASLLLALGALYVKQTGFYVFLALALFLVVESRTRILRRSAVWRLAALGLVLLLPLAAMQAKFGGFNLVSVAGRDDIGIPVFSVESFTYYVKLVPEALSLPTGIAGGIGLLLAARRSVWQEDRMVVLLMYLWLFVGYIVLTAISLKSTPRIGLPLFVPVAFFAAVAVEAIAKPGVRLGVGAALLVMGLGTTAAYSIPPHVPGYREAAAKIVELASPGALVMFSGHRDGDFIFNMRELDLDKEISVLRSDKLLLNIAIMPALGVDAKEYDEATIRQSLTDLGVSYVVSTPKFWSHIPVMERLWNVLSGDSFAQLAEISGPRWLRGEGKLEQLLVFENLRELPENPRSYRIQLRAIDMELTR
jgi:4-amino-4-deoxy-L-arabinose transferase-like glycosyltransferase